MTDPDAAALLRAIVRHPDDDTPRRVYADWLQENGRAEEAELLRVQCDLARAEPRDPDYSDLLDRDEELRLWLAAHVPGPRPTFPAGLSVEGGSWWWPYTERGFPRFLEFDGALKSGARAMRALASALERAFDALPTRWLVVRDVTAAQLAALLKQPVLAKVTQLTVALSVYGDEADDVARLLAKCRHLRNLTGLSARFAFGDAGCEALANGPWHDLEWFSPTCHQFTAVGVRALGVAAWFRNLRSLAFDDLPDSAFEALARCGPFSRLHSLDLTHGSFGEPALRTFGASRAFPALQKLVLDETDLSRSSFAAVAGAGGFALRALSLRGCGLWPGAGAALAAAPWADTLHTLDLSYNLLFAADVKALARCKRFGALRRLDLRGAAIDPAGLTALAANPALRGLRWLGLRGLPPHNRGLKPTDFDRFLAKLNLPDLRYLDLSGQAVGARSTRRLTEPKFASLARLLLGGSRLTDPAAAALVTAPSLSNLIQLDLADNNLAAAPELLADRSVLPRLAVCGLGGNAIPAPVARRLRRRVGVQL